MKDEICRAFCNEVAVREVPAGLAISTAFRKSDGDVVAFYVVRNDQNPALVRLEDDGQTVPYLEAAGVDFDTQTRAKAFEALLTEHDAEFDEDERVIHSPQLREQDAAKAALNFAALLLRMSDFLLLREEHVESTFREDAAKRIRETIGDRASIRENEPVIPDLGDAVPDMVLEAVSRVPVAVFFVQSPTRAYEALLLQMMAMHEVQKDISVIALLEAESAVSRDVRQKAANRLSAVPVFSGDEAAAIHRIEREVIGVQRSLH